MYKTEPKIKKTHHWKIHIGATLIITLGLIFLISNLNIMDNALSKLWPVFLLIIGIITGIGLPSYATDGEALFLEKCSSCHKDGGEAEAFAPVLYAAIQWERYFDKNKHKRKKDISALVTEDELSIIKQYLIDHAADSAQPVIIKLK